MNSQELDQAWSQLSSHIKNYPEVSTGSFEAFFSRLQPQAMSIDYHYLMVTADTPFIKDWVQRSYKQLLIQALEEIYGGTFTVDIEVDPNQVVEQPKQEAPQVVTPVVVEATIEEPVVAPVSVVQSTQTSLESAVKAERFDNFVTGESNILAYELAVQVAAEPGKTRANPLFIYGKSGLGKTHLLQAIKNEIEATIPNFVVKYTDTWELVSRLSEASLKHFNDPESYKKFSDSFLNADVLLIDDVQVLATKSETLSNVFQFMNKFKSQGKQIVLAADRAPRNIEIDQRYTSRFSEGTIQDIGTPSIETKVSIIKRNLEEYREDTGSDFNLPREVMEYIAEASSSNIRELKGAISRLSFTFEYSKQPWQTITKEQVEKVLQDTFSGGAAKRLTATDIQREVADFYKVSVSDIISSKRSRPIAHARQVAIYLCHKMLGLTQSDIGKLFGNRDHSTIMYSENTVATQIKENWEFKEEIDLLTQIIRES